MTYEPKLIAPFDDSNLKKWYKPWITGSTAFPLITDAYARRGVVRKREGFRVFGTLPLESGSSPPVQGIKNWINPSTLSDNLICLSLIKSYLFTDFTQTFSDITQLSDATVFSFGNSSNNYYWTSNYAGSMWLCNGLGLTTGGVPNAVNGILYLTANAINSWNIHQPQIDGTPNYLNGALIVIPHKGRLVCLNTIEGNANGSNNTSYSNRARWSQIGTPYVATGGGHPTSPPSPFSSQANAWRSDIPGKGGFADADTSERIVSAAIIKDTLIVFFQRSTWRLRYTGSEILPFIWERLNTQYGSESPYSTVPFDDAAITFSRFGWIASDTNDVVRVDLDIPDDSFAFDSGNVNLSGLNLVQGIRDYFRNFAYFTYVPIGQSTGTQIYAYNYIDKSWTIFQPQQGTSGNSTPLAINSFGAYRNTSGDYTWSVLNSSSDIWSNYNTSDDTWQNFGAGQNVDFPYTLGGDLNGNVYTMFEFFQFPTTDNGTNFPFSIFTKRFNPYLDQGMKCRLGYVDIYCTTNIGGEITLNLYTDDQQTPVLTRVVEIFSRGVINISSISVGTTTSVTTTQDHGLEVNQTFVMSDIVGSVGKVLNNNTYKVSVVSSTTAFTFVQVNGSNVNSTGYVYLQGGFIYNGDLVQGDSKYTRVYLGAIAHMHQIQLTLTPTQVADPVKGTAQFELQGLVIWTRSTGGRIRG